MKLAYDICLEEPELTGELKAYLEQAGFHDIQIHKKKSWLCITARK